MPPPDRPESQTNRRAGVWYALGAYCSWGFVPLYFHAVASVPAWLILCHRVLWSSIFIAAIISVRREWAAVVALVRQRRNAVLLFTSAILIAINWLVFIYSIGTGQLLQASLGYFINPLLSVGLGTLFLREKLRPVQWIAVCIALVGVINLAFQTSGFPWIAISLALSFAFYGLVRKKVNVNTLHGLLIETTILLPLAIAALWFWPAHSQISTSLLGLLMLSGVVTAVPLLLYGAGVRKLSLSSLGFMQYLSPILQFLVALLLFGEHLDRTRLLGFAICWIAIAVYLTDLVWESASREQTASGG